MTHNPLRTDPSRTATLRRMFTADLKRRMKSLREEIKVLVVEKDSFGLIHNPLFSNRKSWNGLIGNEVWRFLSDKQKLDKFREWLASESSQSLIAVTSETVESGYWNQYVNEAYLKGVNRSFSDVKKLGLVSDEAELAFLGGSRQQFIRQLLANPLVVERIRLLTTRVFNELNGLSDNVVKALTRNLADGLTTNLTSVQINGIMRLSLEKLGNTSGLMIPRTEIVRIHAEGQLDALEQLGVKNVGVNVEWTTATNPCPLCSAMAGTVIPIERARGMIPRHIGCLCSFSMIKEKVIRTRMDSAFLDSVRAELPKTKKRSLRKQRKLSDWLGAK